jgi:2-oxo-4-hydroxy-4-carboxy-5-ureidoimidazoline decarboxylase
LDRCSPEEFARFQALNHAYKEKFAFPFILAVAGKTRHDILAAFERRIENDRETEFRTALAEIDKIARIRLEAMAAGSQLARLGGSEPNAKAPPRRRPK